MVRRVTLISIFIVGMVVFGLYFSAETIYAARVCRYVSCPGNDGCKPAPGNKCKTGTCIECTETSPPEEEPRDKPAPTSPPPPTLTPTPGVTCTDSDGGSFPNVFGKTTIKYPTVTSVQNDECMTLSTIKNADGTATTRWVVGSVGTHVAEKTCYADTAIQCPFGCSNGACNQTLPSATPIIYCNSNPKAQTCPNGYVCIQPSMPPCPEGRMCKQEMPQMQCVIDNCPIRSKGDANCDQAVNDADYPIWKTALQGIRYFIDTHSADFNKDGSVTIVDFEIWRATMHK